MGCRPVDWIVVARLSAGARQGSESRLLLVTVYGQTLDRKSMLALYPHNDRFSAFSNHGVYYVDSATSGIFEETPFHPERLLREYVKLFHPDLLPDYSLQYYKPMGD